MNSFQAAVCSGTVLSLVIGFRGWAEPNAWTAGSGNWDNASSWSQGVLPDSTQSIFITNSGWKAVAINPSTPINFPGSMTVDSLTVSGSTNTENTLLLNFFGTAVPLTVLNGLTVADDGQLLNFNSGLDVQGGAVTVTNSRIIQDGGFIRATNAPMDLNNSVYEMTNGVFEASSVSIGYPMSARFNQYGGAVRITNLGLDSYIPGAIANGYSLYGGTLDLPGGMFLLGEAGGVSYFQSGGTNRTTQITVEPDYGGWVGGFTLNGGLLADSGFELMAGYRTLISVDQNGGTHVITNTLFLAGSSPNGFSVDPATYNLNGGTLSAGVIELDADDGDAVFVQQANSTVSAGTVYAHSVGWFGNHNTIITLLSGTLSCSNYVTDDGGAGLNQSGGALIVSNLLDFSGAREIGITIYGHYTFTGGTLSASNINIGAVWIIGDGTPNRVSNPGFFRLSHALVISNAVEQLGRFILGTNAIIDLAGSASQLSFANSSGETWAGGSTLVISNWNGNLSGGGAEQLKFGTSQSGLTSGQLGQIQFAIGSNSYPAKILSSGEVVPDQGTTSSGPVNSWINPASGNWDDASSWSLGVLPASSQSVMITNTNWKAVAINPSTPTNFPGSMTVSNLTIRGSTNTENTLLLNFFGTALPLTVLNGLTVADDAKIVDFNSSLVVQSGTIIVTNSQIIQDGGFIRATNAPMYLQNAVYNLTNGVFEAGIVQLGFPTTAQFNQYGGTALISDLEFGRNVASAGGAYSLYGGELDLPNGLTLEGGNNSSSSYLQAGGTNRTTNVLLEGGIFGPAPDFMLNGGLLADNNVSVIADNFGTPTINQNGGSHIVTNVLNIAGSAASSTEIHPGTYRLNNGTLSAGTIILAGSAGDAEFVQTNGTTHAGQIQANGYWIYKSDLTLSGGSLTASNLSFTDGANIHQYAGALVVSNSLAFAGYREPGPKLYSRYELFGGTLSVSNISVGGDWIIGDSSTNRISNPGTCILSHTLVISNAVEQLGRFILASNATIDLAGNASRLSFAKSSAETWAGGATLAVLDWNGNVSGGGAEQLRFGTDSSGLTPMQLSQIQFHLSNSTNVYSAKILNTGEVVPDQALGATIGFTQSGHNFVLTWPSGWTLQTATNVPGPYVDVPGATSPYTNDTTVDRQRFFRLRQ
jgi:hypothetical protein